MMYNPIFSFPLRSQYQKNMLLSCKYRFLSAILVLSRLLNLDDCTVF